jgi:hypothetical protein
VGRAEAGEVIEVGLTLAGMTRFAFERPPVQAALKAGLASAFGVTADRVTIAHASFSTRRARRALASLADGLLMLAQQARATIAAAAAPPALATAPRRLQASVSFDVTIAVEEPAAAVALARHIAGTDNRVLAAAVGTALRAGGEGGASLLSPGGGVPDVRMGGVTLQRAVGTALMDPASPPLGDAAAPDGSRAAARPAKAQTKVQFSAGVVVAACLALVVATAAVALLTGGRAKPRAGSARGAGGRKGGRGAGQEIELAWPLPGDGDAAGDGGCGGGGGARGGSGGRGGGGRVPSDSDSDSDEEEVDLSAPRGGRRQNGKAHGSGGRLALPSRAQVYNPLSAPHAGVASADANEQMEVRAGANTGATPRPIIWDLDL